MALVIILAALPGLPLDDYLYIGTGAASINPLKLNAYILVGKLIKAPSKYPSNSSYSHHYMESSNQAWT
ncbi:hypothetical protein [Vulcanisaeta sp. JCM 16161]|uniref:hypothetical protein n=1 Tax=Vulcanisaeta sp. JCM 16161 TaxID=1295372 RepID=UPI0006D14143|nr:hypothetical protein [Vulcanisaeta sp. JCM 16161]